MKSLLLLLLTFFLYSCNTTKKGQRALKMVEADIDLLTHAGEKYIKLNPCQPDTIKIGLVITRIDSSYGQRNIEALNNTIDSILNSYTKDKGINIDSLRYAIKKEVEKNCKPKTIYERRVDTIRDKRQEEILRNKIQAKENEVNKLQGENSQQKTQISEEKKANTKKSFIIAGLGLVILGLIYFIIRGK